MENEYIDRNIIEHYSQIRYYKKIIKDLELKIYQLQLEIDHLKRLLVLNHIKYEWYLPKYSQRQFTY